MVQVIDSDENVILIGYYSTPWQWDKIKANAGWIAQFCSTDDPYIPITEPRYIHKELGTDYHELSDHSQN